MTIQNKKVQYILDRFAVLSSDRSYWDTLYELVADYLTYRKESFTSEDVKGEFLTDQIFDNTAVNSNDLMASAMVNALYPRGIKTFKINPAKTFSRSQQNLDYFSKITKIQTDLMDNPKANLMNALSECLLEEGAYGTSAVAFMENKEEEERTETPFIYKCYNIKKSYIDENDKGIVDTIYYKYQYNIRQLVEKFGLSNVSNNSRIKYENQDLDAKVIILQAIEPSKNIYGPTKKTRKKYASIYLEKDNNHILQERGYDDLPVIVVRFQKRSDEVRGRGPGISALPEIIQANAQKESIIMAEEKMLDPPLAILDVGGFGNQSVDTSAGAINPFSVTGNLGAHAPIFPLFTVGDITPALSTLQELKQTIKEHFYLDRLLDLPGKNKEMTVPEVQIRNNLRGKSLGTIFGRQETELFIPLITRTFNYLLENDYLGVKAGSEKEQELLKKGVSPEDILTFPPDVEEAIKNNLDVYEIEFISPASRMRRNEEATGLLNFLSSIMAAAQIDPSVLDNVNFDKFLHKMADLFGVDLDLINGEDKVAQIRELRAQQQMATAQLEANESAAKTELDLSMATSMKTAALKAIT
jgi:hypothetical protein